MKKTTLLFTSLLILFLGCEENLTESEKKSFEKENLIEKKEPKSHRSSTDLLKDMGFDFNQQKVEIDINKTDNFFKKIEIEMHSKAEEIERKIENAEIDFKKNIGIEISENKIGIDLNKTRNMLQDINSLIKDIVLDINTTTN